MITKPRPRSALIAATTLVTFLWSAGTSPAAAQRQTRGGAKTSTSSANTANRGGGGGSARANSASANTAGANRGANANANANRNNNGNRNTNVNNNTNVNRNTNVNIDSDDDWDGFDNDWDDDWDNDDHHPVAAAMAIGATAAVIGSIVNQPPANQNCVPVGVNGVTYQQCGSTWYQPQYAGEQVQYVVVAPPQ